MGSPLAARLGLLAAAAVLAVAAFLNAYANVTANGAASLSLPWTTSRAFNGAIERELATQRFDRATLGDLSARSLDAQLLNPAAIRTVGLLRGLDGNDRAAANIVGLAERMSRRDLGTQLWLIENAVTRGDLREALRHYDIALRASRASAQLLFPILSKAISDPAIRVALKPYVVNGSAWVPRFLIAAASDAASIEDAARVVLDAGRIPPGKDFATVSATFVPNLAASRKWAALQAYYLRMPGADPRLLQSAEFRGRAIDRELAPLAWAITEQPNLFGQFETGGGGNALVVSAQDSSSGWAAQKVLFLGKQRHAIAVNYEWTDAADGAQATVALYCGDNQGGAPIARLPLQPGANTASGSFAVPDRCPAQVLRVEARGGYDRPMTVMIRRIALRPITR